MTTTNKWIAGAVVAALAILAGGWFLLIAPKRAEAADVQVQADAQLATNDGLQTSVEVLKQQEKSLPEEQAKLAELRTQVPQATNMPSLVRQLDQAASKAGVDLVSLTPSEIVPLLATVAAPTTTDPTTTAPTTTPPTTTDPSTTAPAVPTTSALSAVNADVEANGSYFEIERFVNSLENLDRYVLVTDVTVGEDTSTSPDNGATNGAQPTKGELTSTLSIRVFLLPDTPVTTSSDSTGSTTGSTTAEPAA